MDAETYKKKLAELSLEFQTKKIALAVEYATIHNPYKIGDIFTDHSGKIKIEKIQTTISYLTELPSSVYYGLELKKDGTPKKSNSKRQAWQTNDLTTYVEN
jgi:hypothetical protein